MKTTNIPAGSNTAAAPDLEQMRAQLNLLKQKLDRQTIVTNSLIHTAMRQKMSWIDKYLWLASLVLFPFVCVSWWAIKQWCGLSWWSYGLLVTLTAGCIIADIVINRMKPADWEDRNLMQTALKLARMKHTRKIQVHIQVGLLLIVMAAICYDACTAHVIPIDELQQIGTDMLIGLVIGGAIGLCILGRMQRTNDDLIKQINELANDRQETL